MRTAECSSVVLCGVSESGWQILSLDTTFSLLSGAPSVPGRLLDSLLHPAPAIDTEFKISQTVHWFRHAPSLPPVTLTAIALPRGANVSKTKQSVEAVTDNDASDQLVSCHFVRSFASAQPSQILHSQTCDRPVRVNAIPDHAGPGSSTSLEVSHDLRGLYGGQYCPLRVSGQRQDQPEFCQRRGSAELLQNNQTCPRHAPSSRIESKAACLKEVERVLLQASQRLGDAGAQCHPLREASARAIALSDPPTASSSSSSQSCNTAFLANMLSHELRTPLNGIVSLAELLLRTCLTPEQRDLLDTVLESGQSLTRILSSIIDFSQLNSGLVELTLREFNVCDVIESCIDMVHAEAASKGLVVSSTLPRGAMTSLVIGDSLRIRQVLVHLLSNAVKFTDTGLIELVATARSSNGFLTLTIQVIDTGTGIPDSFKPRLFTGFTQALASCTRVHGGMGLGLAIANNLAKLMDANLTLSSEVGEGTTATFEILLPIAPENDGGSHDSSAASGRPESLWVYAAGDRPCTSDLGTLMLEDTSTSLHALLQEDSVGQLHKVGAVVCLEHAGLRRQVQAICEALGMHVAVSPNMPSGSTPITHLGTDSQVLFCQAGAVLDALRHGWKRRPIVALCTEGQLPHMLRVHAAALATPIKVRELILALQLAINDCPRRTSLLVPLGRPKAATPPMCTAGFGRSACGFCAKCQSATAAEVDAARKRISLDNSALEKIPRKLSQPANVLSRCSEDSMSAVSTTSGDTGVLRPGEHKPAKDSSVGTGGSRGSTLNDLAMEEAYTTSAMSHTSAENVTAPAAADKAPEPAIRSDQAASRLHSYRLPPHAHPLDVAMARGRSALLEQRRAMVHGSAPQASAVLRAEEGEVLSAAERAPTAELREMHLRKSVSLTDIVDKAKDRTTMSVALQSFLYQPISGGSTEQCIPEETQVGGESWGVDPQPAAAAHDASQRGQLPALPGPAVPVPGGYGRPLKILIAEDNKINQLVTRKVVGKVRPCCEIDVVSDGEAALLTILEKPEYDLVLMDLHMPRMDGLEATRRVRERHPLRPLIVALTADTVVGTRQKCLAAGMNEYVSKPFHVKDMQRILQMCG